MTLETVIRAAKASDDVGRIVAAIPYAGFLGIGAEWGDNGLVTTLAFREHNVGNPALPAIHGGVIGAFLETAAILHLLWHQESIRVPKTITITVDYLRSAGPKETRAQSSITKLGRRIANVRVQAWQAEPAKPVAVANANFLVTPGP